MTFIEYLNHEIYLLFFSKISRKMSLKSKRGRISQLSIIEVNRLNLNAVWPCMLLSIKNADLVAIDLVSR